MPCKPYSSRPWIAQILESFIVPLKADVQALACPGEYNDNDHLLMPAREAISDDYAPGTQMF